MVKKTKVFLIGIFIFVTLIFAVLVLAIGNLVTIQGITNSYAIEDRSFLYNITINNTDTGTNNSVFQVNITLPAGFTLTTYSLNASNSNNSATNQSYTSINDSAANQVLSWSNFTGFPGNDTLVGLIQATHVAYFWFNATAVTPGNYTIVVTTVNGTGLNAGNTTSTKTFNISVQINDTTVPSSISYGVNTEADGANLTRDSIIVNVTGTDNGNYTLTIRIFNLTNGNYTSGLNSSSNSGSVPSFYVNFTAFGDGKYYFNATIVDLGTNANATLNRTITIDRTGPSVNPANFTGAVVAGTNASGNGLYLNASVLDVTLGTIGQVSFNITNITGGHNASLIATREAATNSYSVIFNTTSFPDGIYNISIFSNDTLGNRNDTARITVRFDNTVPQVSPSNISSPTSGSNFSGLVNLIVVNVSVNDVTSSVEHVFFNITNSTGAQNATFRGIREAATDRFSNATINVSGFRDGTYNITIFSNDSAGNRNNTARVHTLLFDSTAPTGTLVCSPGTVNQGETVTCTCSPSDATSGINTSATSNTANPSTTNTGTFTTSCSFKDLAGNSGSTSTTYNVEGGGDGAGAGGGGGGGGAGAETEWTTYPVNDEALEEGHTRVLRERQRLRVNIQEEDHFVGVAEVGNENAIIEVASTPQRATMKVGETKNFEVTGDNFYDIRVSVDSISSQTSSAKITLTSIQEAIPPAPVEEPEEKPVQETKKEVPKSPIVEEKKSRGITLIIIISIAIALAIVFFIMRFKKNN